MRTFCGSAMSGKNCFRQKKTPPDRSGGVFAYGTVRNGAGATVAGTTANGCLRRRFRRLSTALRSPRIRSRSLRVVSAKAPNPINSTICKSAVTTATAPCGNSSGLTGLAPMLARSARAAFRSATSAARSAASPSSRRRAVQRAVADADGCRCWQGIQLALSRCDAVLSRLVASVPLCQRTGVGGLGGHALDGQVSLVDACPINQHEHPDDQTKPELGKALRGVECASRHGDDQCGNQRQGGQEACQPDRSFVIGQEPAANSKSAEGK
jgi:hypothetical protein